MRYSPVLLAAVVAFHASAHATLLVYDSFDGNSLGALAGQTSTDFGISKTATYGISTTVGATANVTAGGLVFSTLNSSSGNSITASSANSGTNLGIALALDSTVAAGSTLYCSYIVDFTALSTGAGLGEVRLNDTINGNGTASRFRLMADSAGGSAISPGVSYDQTQVSGGSLNANTNYLIIGRFTNVNTALSASTVGQADLFALTEAQYDAFILAGGSDSFLDSAVIGTNVAAHVSDAPVTSGTFNFATGNFLQTGFTGSTTSTQTFKYDAIRFGTALTDVTTVPEPTAAALFLGALTPFLAARRRRLVRE